ncbi:MAG: hypothetical protein OXG71_00710, partial [Rhodospirillales bacterium]|nr:hypothetical protein [Rhodospirillales bacterium]
MVAPVPAPFCTVVAPAPFRTITVSAISPGPIAGPVASGRPRATPAWLAIAIPTELEDAFAFLANPLDPLELLFGKDGFQVPVQ